MPHRAEPGASENRREPRFALDARPRPVAEPGRVEPALVVLPLQPLLFGFADAPSRLTAPAPDAAVPPAAAERRMPRVGLLASLLVHLSPLLLLLSWSAAPAETAAPIPIQLVIEEPPPAPPLTETTPPSPGRLASVDMSERAAPEQKADNPETAADKAELRQAAEPRHAAEPHASEQRHAAAPPQRNPVPPPELATGLAKPAPAPDPALAGLRADLVELARPPPQRSAAARLPSASQPAGRAPRIPGPDATRDEYLAYCHSLIQRNHGMLSSPFLAGRSGQALIHILVLGDGTIARVSIVQSTGYPDIDARLAQMVAAVRRFPPPPARVERASMEMGYLVSVPEGLVSQ